MAKVLIVYYSRSGNTAKMAKLVAEGVRKSGAEVSIGAVADISADDLKAADGIIIGSPTYYGVMAAEIKRLIDDSVKFHGELVGKVGGAFTSSGGPGGGNETTLMSILQALLIHGMIVPGNVNGDHYGPIAVGAPDDRSAKECRKVGEIVGNLTVKLFGR